jgi:hypothetical protein
MGNTHQYQVIIIQTNGKRAIYPAPDEAWDDKTDAEFAFTSYLTFAKRRPKLVDRVLLVDSEQKKVLKKELIAANHPDTS